MDYALIILFSLSLGSFSTNMVNAFLPGKVFDVLQSKCQCGARILLLRENIPLLSFLFSKGKCGECHNRLTDSYLFLEVSIPVIALMLYLNEGLTLEYFLKLLISYIVIIIGVVDYKSFTIPNFLLTVLLLLNLFLLDTAMISDKAISVLIVVTLLTSMNFLIKQLKGIWGMGWGDIKLIAVLGLFFEPVLFLFFVWISALISIPGHYLLKKKNMRFNRLIPFGSFLAIGFCVTLLFETPITNLMAILYN